MPGAIRFFTRTLLVSATLLPASLWAAGAAPTQVRQAVTAERAAVIDTITTITRIESGSSHRPGLDALASVLADRLTGLGAKVERTRIEPGGGEVVVGRLTGRGSKAVMLIAHYDTVHPAGILQTEPVRTEGNRLYGPGVADSKGGIGLMLHAVQVLQRLGEAPWGRLTLLFNPDEETGSRGSGPIIQQLAAGHDTVLSFEPTLAVRDSVLTGASGTANAILEVKGRAAHAGVEPEAGRNALIELAHQILQLSDLSDPASGLSLNWTVARAGDARNVIPASATATADVRMTDMPSLARLESTVRERIARRRIADTEVSFRIDINRPPFKGDARTEALVAQARALYGELGLSLNVIGTTGGGTDAGYAQAGGRAGVLESLGMPGMGFHARPEWIDLDKIEPRLYLTVRMIQETSR